MTAIKILYFLLNFFRNWVVLMATYLRHPLISKFQNQRNKVKTDIPSLFILLEIRGAAQPWLKWSLEVYFPNMFEVYFNVLNDRGRIYFKSTLFPQKKYIWSTFTYFFLGSSLKACFYWTSRIWSINEVYLNYAQSILSVLFFL